MALKEIQQSLKKFFDTKTSLALFAALGALLVIVLVFEAGTFVGYRKAAFSFHYGDNYYRAFEHDTPSGGMNPLVRQLPNAHGATGEVVSIALPTFVVDDISGIEKTVEIQDETVIRKYRDQINPDGIAVGDFTVVIGEPNAESHIDARLVRILPPPPGIPISKISTTSTQ